MNEMHDISRWFIVLPVLILVAAQIILTSFKTSRRLKKGELKHHVEMISDLRGCQDKVAIMKHYEDAIAILDDHHLWRLTLDDVGYKGDRESLKRDAEGSFERYAKNVAIKMKPLPSFGLIL